MDKLERLKKYANGGKVAKLDLGGHVAGPYTSTIDNSKFGGNLSDFVRAKELEIKKNSGAQLSADEISEFNNLGQTYSFATGLSSTSKTYTMPTDDEIDADIASRDQLQLETFDAGTELRLDSAIENANVSEEERAAAEARAAQQTLKKSSGKNGGLSALGSAALGASMNAAVQVINGVDQAFMGDKNFSASSKAIDTTVHGVSGALMKSGNPWAMGAAVALEGINFATKAGGKNVQGYDVGIENSGYGNLGHMDSEAGRFWNNMEGKLRKRNEQARMALAAADVSEDIKFEQEARANSIDDILRQNTIALNGGIDTSLLGN